MNGNTNELEDLKNLEKDFRKVELSENRNGRLLRELQAAIAVWESKTYKQDNEYTESLEAQRDSKIELLTSFYEQLTEKNYLSSKQIELAEKMIDNARNHSEWREPQHFDVRQKKMFVDNAGKNGSIKNLRANENEKGNQLSNQTVNTTTNTTTTKQQSSVSAKQPTTSDFPAEPPGKSLNANKAIAAKEAQTQVQIIAQTQQTQQPQQPVQPAKKSWIPTAKSKPVSNLNQNTITIYGPNGCGKSALLASWPDCLVFATEPSYKGLEVLKIPEDKQCFETWQDFIEAIVEVTKANLPNPLAIDSLSGLVALARPVALAPLKVKHESELDYGKGYDALNNLIFPILTKVSRLCANRSVPFILVGHSKDKETVSPSGGKVTKKSLDVPPSLAKNVADLSDILVYMAIEKVRTKNGWQVQRVLRTSSTPNYDARSRVHRLPEKIVVPFLQGYQAIEAAWNGLSLMDMEEIADLDENG